MKKYYISVILKSGTTQLFWETKVEADLVSWSDGGVYEFSKSENGVRVPVAYYPVSSTIIERIEKISD